MTIRDSRLLDRSARRQWQAAAGRCDARIALECRHVSLMIHPSVRVGSRLLVRLLTVARLLARLLVRLLTRLLAMLLTWLLTWLRGFCRDWEERMCRVTGLLPRRRPRLVLASSSALLELGARRAVCARTDGTPGSR